MENYRGDLTDIIRATGGGGGAAASAVSMSNICDQEMLSDDTVDWELSANPMNNYPPPPCGIKENTDEFGDPFSNRRDPLLLLLQQDPAAAADTTIPSCSGGGGGSSSIIFRNNPSSSGVVVSEEAIKETTTTTTDSFVDQGRNGYDHLRHHSKMIIENEDEEGGQQQQQRNYTDRPAANIFSRMLQISPQNHSSRPSLMMTPDITSPRGGSPGIIPNDHRHHQIHHHHVHSNDNNNNNHLLLINNTSKTTSSSLIENNGGGGGAVQISSPRNAGIKRRKSQAKKVVCIPAPAPANSRPSSGEVVPSDLWAWRKYGQKPIKGSPYPRGYYRCSSSKGCSARKQVERSRTDPNMLVITYTSEHNHPWPTQRNALAGSTRAQPAATKGGGNHVNCSSNSSSSNKIIKAAAATSNCFLKQNEDGIQAAAAENVKEEMVDEEHEKEEEEDHSNYYREGGGISVDDQVMSELGFPLESYRPDMLAAADTNNFPQLLHHQEDLFGGLGGGGGGEMETDPLNLLLFTQGFSGMVNQEEEVRESTNAVKTNSDPFAGLFDWAASTSGADDDQPKS